MRTAARRSSPATDCDASRRWSRSSRICRVGSVVTVETCAGMKTLELLAIAGTRYTFRTALGPPADVRQVRFPCSMKRLRRRSSRSAIHNASCWVHCRTRLVSTGWAGAVGPLDFSGRHQRRVCARGGTRSRSHPDLGARRRADDLVRNRIVGFGGRGRGPRRRGAKVDVIAPGGIQRVEWREDGIYRRAGPKLVLEGTAYL